MGKLDVETKVSIWERRKIMWIQTNQYLHLNTHQGTIERCLHSPKSPSLVEGKLQVMRYHLLVPSYSWFLSSSCGKAWVPLPWIIILSMERCGLPSLGAIPSHSHSIHCPNLPKCLWAAFSALQTYAFPQLPRITPLHNPSSTFSWCPKDLYNSSTWDRKYSQPFSSNFYLSLLWWFE